MKTGSLCSGYEGIGLGLAAVEPVELAWVADNDPAASLILSTRYPDTPNLGDITTTDWKGVDSTMKHQLAQDMYDQYCQGLSIEQVATQFGRSRQTVWKMFSRRGWSTRPRPPARPEIVHSGRRYTLGNGGYYRATDGDRQYLHRAIWEEHHGDIPSDCDVHHRDHDKTNNDIKNLMCMTKADHTRLHAKGVMPNDSPALDLLTAGYP